MMRYQRLHSGKMELDEFKRIYFVEWFHRLPAALDRSVGHLLHVPPSWPIGKRSMNEDNFVLKEGLSLQINGIILGISDGCLICTWSSPSAAFLAPPRHVGPNCGAFVRGSVGLLCRPRHSTGTAGAEPHRSFCSGPFTSLRGLVDGQAWFSGSPGQGKLQLVRVP